MYCIVICWNRSQCSAPVIIVTRVYVCTYSKNCRITSTIIAKRYKKRRCLCCLCKYIWVFRIISKVNTSYHTYSR
uniref:Uncharacterized protein n=1 Tax=uncultured marine virus TaxID=186617 RepID=A0A0F7L3N7_9VIRU|nr:hypothetical protein [uncultured marine virus]